MRQFQIFIFILFLSTVAFAQVPPAFNYQAVARNNTGVALANQTIQVRLSIYRGATSLYSETRSVTTNLLGLFNVQIGAAGATSTTGDFNAIYWLNNTPWITLKVELDISNTNVFTDMGSQPLTSVPYALAASNAIDAVNLGGRYVDPVPVPATGDVLQWNGAAWTPFTLPAQPTVGGAAGFIPDIPFGGVTAPWVFAGPTKTVTVNGPQDIIIATGTAVFGHNSSSPQACSFSMCYSLTPSGSPISEFFLNAYPDGTVPSTPNKVNLTATGFLTGLAAGSYKIGFGIKNKSGSVVLSENDFMTMSYQVIRN